MSACSHLNSSGVQEGLAAGAVAKVPGASLDTGRRHQRRHLTQIGSRTGRCANELAKHLGAQRLVQWQLARQALLRLGQRPQLSPPLPRLLPLGV